MKLSSFVDRLRHDLATAAAAGGPEAKEAADRIALALDPAVRLMLLEALSRAAAEITGSLDRDAVDVRLNGREPEFVITRLEPDANASPPTATLPSTAPEEDAGQARITLRLPEPVKARAEEAAYASGLSLNAWLVDAVRDTLDGRRIDLELASSPMTVTGDAHRRRQVRGRAR
jgi:hypothetical protein